MYYFLNHFHQAFSKHFCKKEYLEKKKRKTKKKNKEKINDSVIILLK